jgi:signal transduction histidine kinase
VLAAGVAHEISNPLAAVLANVECARAELAQMPDADGALGGIFEALADAQEAANRLRFIVRDLKTFSRVDDDLEPIDVTAAMDTSLRLAWNEVRHRAQVVKEYGEGLPRVRGNDARVGQVFLNLIINATHAMSDDARATNTLRLVTRFDGERVVAEVHDNGPGIPPETLKRIFTPFFTTKARGVGTGLGLSICRRIVESFGGEIGVDTSMGRGTTFRVSWPPCKEHLTAEES